MTIEVREIHRLSKESYDKLVEGLPLPYIGKDTTELQAAQQVGIELVLRRLREGYVTGG
jgi:hypothetical protein